MPRRAALYARISRDRVGAGLGVDRQLTDCRELAQRLKWAIVAEFTDNDLSAYSGKPRPGYQALLDELRAGRADAVIAWHPDRLHRRPIELEKFINLCEERAVNVQTVKSGEFDLSTPSGRAVARTVGAWARHEVEHMIERQRSAKLQAAAAGEFLGGRRAFGFEPDGVTHRIEEARIVREMCSRIIAGESLASLARDLNGRGIRGTFSASWTGTTLRAVLIRPRNAGLSFHHGKRMGTARWAPIVDEATWLAVRAILAAPGRVRPKTLARRWLGSGLYRCGRCGGSMRITSAPKSRRLVSKWGYECAGPSAHVYRSAEPVDALVVAHVVSYLTTLTPEILVADAPQVDGAALLERAAGVRARMDELAALFASGVLEGSQLAEGTRVLRAELEAVEAAITAAAVPRVLDGLVGVDDLGATWAALPLDRRRAVVDALMTVTILPTVRGRKPGGGYFDPDSVRIEWTR